MSGSESGLTSESTVRVMLGDLPDDLAAELKRQPRLAVDTETSGLHWQVDHLATCQVFSEQHGAFIVRLNDQLPVNLISLIEDKSISKVFHHAPFDLAFMVRAWGVIPTSVWCTKVASKILTPDADPRAHSLQSLTGQHLGVRLEKGGVRTSDWMQARLSDEQLAYAAADVLHLLDLLDALRSRLDDVKRLELFERSCGFLPVQARLATLGLSDVFAY